MALSAERSLADYNSNIEKVMNFKWMQNHNWATSFPRKHWISKANCHETESRDR
ncbi:hypothetical protein PEPS_41880 (plasmid) [Persicobacter psychrovividus]|uniref:Uncharacterized protein n=1 Tax=Persicobacter psychrovividus TaxID=387638 RepID=A0ABM7VLN4_9BACT|nr:hypothetical protein PEPS_41880 [Persicobacter psychrovividus]